MRLPGPGCGRRRRGRRRRGQRASDGDRGIRGVVSGVGRHLPAGRDDPHPGDVQRGGGGDRQPAALDRHGSGGVGHEAGVLRERRRHEQPHLRPHGGGAQLLDAGDCGARELAGAQWRHDPLGGGERERGVGPHRARPRFRPQGGLAPGDLGGGRAGQRGRGREGRVRGLAEPGLHQRRAPGDGGLRHGRRHGDGGSGLHGDERNADLRRGRDVEDGERADPRRQPRRGRGDVRLQAVERRGRADRRRRGDGDDRQRGPGAEGVDRAAGPHGGRPGDRARWRRAWRRRGRPATR